MKKSKNLLIVFLFLFFSACEATWTMEIELNDNNSGDYRIAILLDQEAQLYAVETGQTSIGGLNAILTAMPDGFGSTIYEDNDKLGILIRNNFQNIEEFENQLEILRENENTELLLLPLSNISITSDGNKRSISGSFAKILNGADEEIEGIENIYSGSLSIQLPGRVTEPNIENIVDNKIIFQHSGLLEQTFLMSSNTQELTQVYVVGLLFSLLLLGYIIARQRNRNK
ncbi:hypothetical protein OAW80_01910 [Acidimicrobiia bacterium]|nr:hypothetical protein [Acidimicrobiia bacterium]